MNGRTTGVVKRWLPEAAYGFIMLENEDLFCHLTDVEGEQPLHVGQVVEFRIVPGRPGARGRRAVDVRSLD